MDIFNTKESLLNKRKAPVFKGGRPKLPEIVKFVRYSVIKYRLWRSLQVQMVNISIISIKEISSFSDG